MNLFSLAYIMRVILPVKTTARFFRKLLGSLPFFARLSILYASENRDKYDRHVIRYASPEYLERHQFLFHASLRGLGILNYQSCDHSGETAFLNSFLTEYDTPESLVIDIGANSGEFAQCVLQATCNLRVISFEPNPYSSQQCKHNLASYSDRWSLIAKALGSKCTEISIWDYKDSQGSPHASIYRDVIERIHGSESASFMAQQVTLDHELRNMERLNPILIKYDVEGHELDAIIGSRSIIDTHRPPAIMVEFNEMNAISRSTYYWLCHEVGDGYIPYRLLPHGKLIPLNGCSFVETEIYAYQNLVFLRK